MVVLFLSRGVSESNRSQIRATSGAGAHCVTKPTIKFLHSTIHFAHILLIMYDVEEVLKKLTLEEKAALLAGKDFWHTVPLPQHGVPSIRVSDGPNGVRGISFFDGTPAACFPCGTSLGATWDTQLLEEAGKLMGDEAKAKNAHVILGPTVNIQRSPLGGRGFESFSEDPLLSGLLAASEINGIQSRGIQATIKHFVCNDQEHERQSVNSIITERALREIYLLPFMLAVRDSKVASFMTAYNKVNGIHVSQSKHILEEILRTEWAWNGLIMTDWYGAYSTVKEVEAGVDLEMPGPTQWRGPLLCDAVKSKEINIEYVNKRAKTVLEFVKKAVTESGITSTDEQGSDTPETRKFLRDIGAAGQVLLKNTGDILPLSKSKKTAIIGPNAKITAYCGGGSAALRPYNLVTPFEGISSKLDSKPSFSLGTSTYKELPLLGPSLVSDKGTAGFKVQAYDASRQSTDRKLLETRYLDDTYMFFGDYNPGAKYFYLDIEGYLSPEEDGEYEFGVAVAGTACLYVDDKLVVDNEKNQTPGTIFFGTGTIEEKGKIYLKQGQKYKISVYFGSFRSSDLTDSAVEFGGGVRIGFVKDEGNEKELQRAVAAAKDADQVVLVIGLNQSWESEGFDRENMDLLPSVDHLVEQVLQANPNTVIVNQSGTPVTMPWASKASAILQSWYGGNETGNAIADVLFGDVNPSGKLPLSFPKRLQDNPSYLHFGAENGRVLYNDDVYVGYRHYDSIDLPVEFPFGHGLSYTKFKIAESEVECEGNDLVITSLVKNLGKVAGKATVQVYISPENPSVRRPLKELKGFSKIFLEPGASEMVPVKIPIKYATSYWNEYSDSWFSEAGTYKVLVGQSSAEIETAEEFTIGESTQWKGI